MRSCAISRKSARNVVRAMGLREAIATARDITSNCYDARQRRNAIGAIMDAYPALLKHEAQHFVDLFFWPSI